MFSVQSERKYSQLWRLPLRKTWKSLGTPWIPTPSNSMSRICLIEHLKWAHVKASLTLKTGKGKGKRDWVAQLSGQRWGPTDVLLAINQRATKRSFPMFSFLLYHFFSLLYHSTLLENFEHGWTDLSWWLDNSNPSLPECLDLVLGGTLPPWHNCCIIREIYP